jgi:hypothetical protein
LIFGYAESSVLRAIPMPSEPLEPAGTFQERTGFETTVERLSNNSEDQTAYPFCNFTNDAVQCVCLAALLSDPTFFNECNADKYVIRKAVERMEKETAQRHSTKPNLRCLGSVT